MVLPIDDRWSEAATALYRKVHESLILALADWGVDASLRGGSAPAGNPDHFLCFLRQADGDVLSRGVKIAGSAQRRARGAILQHGSVLFRTSAYAPELPGVEELTGLSIDRHELARGWSAHLAEKLHVLFTQTELSPAENARAEDLAQGRFGTSGWTNRR
jgi:lipoate-protein ligase A